MIHETLLDIARHSYETFASNSLLHDLDAPKNFSELPESSQELWIQNVYNTVLIWAKFQVVDTLLEISEEQARVIADSYRACLNQPNLSDTERVMQISTLLLIPSILRDEDLLNELQQDLETFEIESNIATHGPHTCKRLPNQPCYYCEFLNDQETCSQ